MLCLVRSTMLEGLWQPPPSLAKELLMARFPDSAGRLEQNPDAVHLLMQGPLEPPQLPALPPLPPNWFECWSDERFRSYYYNPETRSVTWSRPLPAASQQLRTPSPRSAPPPSHRAAPTLPMNWEEYWSEEHNRSYYVTWSRPLPAEQLRTPTLPAQQLRTPTPPPASLRADGEWHVRAPHEVRVPEVRRARSLP